MSEDSSEVQISCKLNRIRIRFKGSTFSTSC